MNRQLCVVIISDIVFIIYDKTFSQFMRNVCLCIVIQLKPYEFGITSALQY